MANGPATGSPRSTLAPAGRCFRGYGHPEGIRMNCLKSMIRPLAALSTGMVLLASAHAEVARNGSLDGGFGSGGKTVLAFPGELFLQTGSFVDIARLPSGQLIVAGTVVNAAGNQDFAAIRLTADGELDTSYGSGGGRRVGFDLAGGALHDELYSVVVQPDGKAILAGSAGGNLATDGSDMALVRLTAAGQLDTSFGSGGRALVPFNLGPAGQRGDYGDRLALQADGKILLVGSAEGSSADRVMAVVRLNANGQRDSTFDGDGRAIVDFDPAPFAAGVQVRQLGDGRILIAGAVLRLGDQGPTADFALARLLANGAPDPAFGTGGRTVFAFDVGGANIDAAYDVVELADGKLMACGFARVNAPANNDMACMRFLDNGSPDPTFAATVLPFDRGGDLSDVAYRTAIDDQGRIVLAGSASTAASNANFAVARMLPDGELDPGFGNGGTVTQNSCMPLCFPTERDNPGSALLVQDDGNLLVAGRVADASGNYRFLILRLIGDVLFSDDFQD
jgi:uncharacterized delta-60 repeat protein